MLRARLSGVQKERDEAIAGKVAAEETHIATKA